MKKITLFLFSLLFLTAISIQDIRAQAYQNGDVNIGGGIGIGSTLTGNGGLPIAAHVEKGFHEAISAGLYVGYASYNYSFWKWTYLIIGARGAYHFGDILSLPDNFDLYGGAILFYQNVTIKEREFTSFTSSSPGSIGFGIYAGGRYYFTDNIAAFAELGSGIAILHIGATFKL